MEDQNPYRTPDAVVAEIADGELADRGTRLGAAIIDGLIMLAILVPLMFVGGYWRAALENGGQVGFGTTLMWALVGFGVFAAVQFVPLNATGQTWGKKFLKIRIVDMAGNSRVGFWPLFVGDHRFVLALGGLPALNHPALVELVWSLTVRYGGAE